MRVVGLGHWLAERPEYMTAAVSTLGECSCVQDTGGSYGVDGQPGGRFDKVQKNLHLEVLDKRYPLSTNSNSTPFNSYHLHFPVSLLSGESAPWLLLTA